MLFNGERGDIWPNVNERRSRLVFIGVKLKHQQLEEGFQKCLVSASLVDSIE